MYACPACKGSSIGFYRKWLSTPVLPAYCSACRTYSHAHRSSGGLGVVVGALVITAGGIAASAVQAVWPLALGIGLAMSFYIWHIHRIPLEALSPQQVLRARETEGMSWLALLAALFLTS
jgi:hypothetical protein